MTLQLLLGSLSLAVAACVAPAESADDSATSIRVPLVYSDGWIEVRSDVLDRASAASLASDAEAAYAFDLEQLAWSAPPALADEPLTIEILSAHDMERLYPGLAGGAIHGTKLVFAEATATSPAFAGLLAHELSHTQSSRMGGGLPHVLEEGKAIVLQREYLHELGVSFPQAVSAAQLYASLDATVADSAIGEFMFDSEAGTQLTRDERVGALLVEDLRVKRSWPYPDIVHDLADCIELMASRSNADPAARFATAFSDELGITFSDGRAGLDALLATTAGDPGTRISGTALAEDY